MSAAPQDPRQEVQKILRFLGKEVTEGTVARILHHTSFQEMRKNPAANYETMPTTLMDHSLSPFLRKGGVWLAGEGLGGVSLGCIAAPIHGCKYFACITICPTRFLTPRDLRGLEEPLYCGPERALRSALLGAHGGL